MSLLILHALVRACSACLSKRRDVTRLRKLAYLQFRMLSLTAFPKVKKMVYSTCSLYEEENEQVNLASGESGNS